MPTSSAANRFAIDSNFEADGNEMLVRCVSEINAIARLKDVSRTDEYKKRLDQCGEKPSFSAGTLRVSNCSALYYKKN